jgi:hypothetical protein
VQWAVLLIVVWAAAYGFVSYQNLGGAVRYRLQILPVLVGLLLYIVASRRAGPAVANAGPRPAEPANPVIGADP